jgi:hypothetical protein
LADDFPTRNEKNGLTDSGEPLHMVVLILKNNLILEPSKNKAVILLNNGIHAEPDGIDAVCSCLEI